MDFDLPPEVVELRTRIADFAKSQLGKAPRSEADPLPRSEWKKCADLGILGLPIPEEHGGTGASALASVVAMEALGYGCNNSGLVFALNSHIWTCELPIARFGTDAQKRRWLPALGSGEIIGGHAISEPDSGSDAFAMKTTARREGDVYVLNGSKTFISNAPIADLLLVFAITNRAAGYFGVSAFLVERGTKGLTTGKPIQKMGLESSPTGEVFLEDCEVPVENRLGVEGGGAAIFGVEMEWERSCLFASHVGAMQSQLEACLAYSKERKQFGQPIGKFQAIAHILADMSVRVELSRLALFKVAWLLDSGKSAALEAMIAKLYISESYVASSLDAIQLHGAHGYAKEGGVEHHLRDAVASRIYSGTSQILRNLIANHLGS